MKHEPPLILVADDYQDTREMYTRVLKLSGFGVVEAADGSLALAMALAVLPRLILMDLSMPLLDGFQATEQLKSNPKTRHIPIIVVTAQSSEMSRRLAGVAGCDAYLTKPCMPHVLLEEIGRLLRSLAAGEPLVRR